MSETIIKTSGLSKYYGDVRALDGVSLELRRGAVSGLLGQNGAGKTTIVNLLMGFLKPDAGVAVINGLDCFRHRRGLKNIIGHLPDDPWFGDYLTGRDIIGFVGELRGMSVPAAAAAAAPLVGEFGLDADLDGFAAGYPRGTRKKLALVCALLHRPELLILDEPTEGLDPRGVRTVAAVIRRQAAEGRTVLMSGHRPDEAERLCDRVAILDHGCLAAFGAPRQIVNRFGGGRGLEAAFMSLTVSGGPAVRGGARRRPAGRPAAAVIRSRRRGVR